jgi:aminopeptidase N
VLDPHSFCRPHEAAVTRLDLFLNVDFEAKTLFGVATWEYRNPTRSSVLVLDTGGIEVADASLAGAGAFHPTSFEMAHRDPLLGSALRIAVPPEAKAGTVRIRYTTAAGARALQWLEPAQTAGGSRPFLFTQSQAILARTWIPCQDSPAVRFAYRARVNVPKDLVALMSAKRLGSREEPGAERTTYEFEMEQPVPSYLVALAVGQVEFRDLGARCGVFAEPPVVEKARWELADTARMLEAAEKLFGRYRWERYDILVLPPSFPFGGMENPRLTFATPTILAGDRSLVSLIAHELSHSWSGNLVTNATWNDFWLNEGFTVYLEHRIVEELYGRDYDEMLAQLGLQDLEKALAELRPGSSDGQLVLDLAGRDPDDAVSPVAYEKGYLFLRLLEESLGRERWDAFLRGYFEDFAFQGVDTMTFLSYLRAKLLASHPGLEERLQIDAWMRSSRLPESSPRPRSPAFAQVESQVRRWTDGSAARSLDTHGWTTHHWLHFLRRLPRPLPHERLRELDAGFDLSAQGNAEVLCEWLLLTVASAYQDAGEALERFLTSVGRRRFLKALYEELVKKDAGRQRALEIYRKARRFYHPIAVTTVDGILGWKE